MMILHSVAEHYLSAILCLVYTLERTLLQPDNQICLMWEKLEMIHCLCTYIVCAYSV